MKTIKVSYGGFETEQCVDECLYNAIYSKAIDDFRNELKNHYTEYNLDCILSDSNFYSYTAACDYLEDYIDKIAEKLKEGRKHE